MSMRLSAGSWLKALAREGRVGEGAVVFFMENFGTVSAILK